jgi:1-acyl-sn-glycerol-3-phosphate acyltransferase
MSFINRLTFNTVRFLTGLICRIDDSQLARIPMQGPWILVSNHITSIEVPVIFTRLDPRPVSGFFAAYRLDNPFLRWILLTFNGIPLRRGLVDRQALDEAVRRIHAGEIFALAPEGTRNRDGRMVQGKSGVVTMALRTGAPIQPLVHWGSEGWTTNLLRLRRTSFSIAVGRPFRLNVDETKVDRQVRERILDEIMLQMANLLPPYYRGVYGNRVVGEPEFLQFLDDFDTS